MLLLVVAAVLGIDLVVFTPLCGVAFACVSGLLIFRLLSRIANGPWGAALAAICLITLTPIFVLYMTLEGNFLIASQLLFLELLAARRVTAAALAAGFSCLVRPDSIVLVLPVLLSAPRTRHPRRLAAFALPGLIWIAFAFVYYGDVLPNTLLAKTRHSDFVSYLVHTSYFAFCVGFTANAQELVRAPSAWGWVLGLIKLALLTIGARKVLRFGRPFFYALIVYPFALVLIYAGMGAYQHHWQIQSASFFFHLAAAAGAISLFSHSAAGVPSAWRRGSATIGAVCALALVAYNLHSTTSFLLAQQTWLGRGAKHELYSDIAKWANQNLARSSRIAATEVGALGFYSEGFAVVDQMGLVSDVFRRGDRISPKELLESQHPGYMLLTGPPERIPARRPFGRRVEPLQTFICEPEDARRSVVTLVRILGEE